MFVCVCVCACVCVQVVGSCVCCVQFHACRQDDPSLGGNSVKMFHLLADPCVCVCVCVFTNECCV